MNLSVLQEDKKRISYRPELNKITNSITATILLYQIIFRSTNGEPFYKFKSPCSHPLYKEGDSWIEELGFSICEFDTALSKISTRINSKTDISQIKTPVYHWTTIDRVTYYQLNLEVLNKKLSEIYDIYVNEESACSKNKNTNLDITNNTSYKEEKKGKDNKEHYNDILLMNISSIMEYYNKGYSSRYGKDKYQLPIENLNGYRTIADNLKKAMFNYKIEDLQLLIDYKWINGKDNDRLESWLDKKYLDTYMDRAYQWLRDGKPEAKTNNMVFDYSGFDDEVVILIKQWFIHRKNMKKSYKTQAGLNGLRNNLIDIQNKLGKYGLIASIQNSMNNEWLKVYPIKKDKVVDSGLFAQPKEDLKFNFDGFGEKSKIKIQQWLDYRNSKKPYQTQIELDVLRDKLLGLYAKSTKNVLCVSRSIDFSIGKGYNDVYEPYWTKEELAEMDSMTFDDMF